MCYLMFLLIFKSAIGNLNNDWYVDFTKEVEELVVIHNNSLSSKCSDHLSFYAQGINSGKNWALRMYDSGAKVLPSGILDGNLIDLGSFEECLSVQHKLIFGKYCLGTTTVDINDNNSTQKRIQLKLAKCFPSTCSALEMELVYAQTGLNITFLNELCQTKADQPEFNAGSIATMSFFGLIIGIVVVSSTYDVFCYYLGKEPAHILLTAFSLFTNGRKLLNTQKNSNDIACLHGIRTLSTMWIILSHVYHIRFLFPLTDYYKSSRLNNEANMFIFSSTLAVDTFLLLAAVLIVYNYMQTTTKGIKFNILVHYFHRYLRLTPVLVVVMLFDLTLVKHVGSGPFWPKFVQSELVDGCKDSWWKVLLYVQNIFGRDNPLCMLHTWYLSLDMQLFILSPFLLLPLQRWCKLSLLLTGSLGILSMVACFCVGWFLELSALMDAPADFDKQSDMVWYYYFPAHTRATPWLIGIILGYLIYEFKEGRLKLSDNKLLNIPMWIVSLTILCVCTFVGHNLITGPYNRLGNSFHLALVRPVWALAVSWVIFACNNGFGGPVNWFLSLPIFQVVSKLTYTLYVTHYTIIFTLVAPMKKITIFNNAVAMHDFWGDFTLVLLVSAVVTLCIEFPIATIDNFLFREKGSK